VFHPRSHEGIQRGVNQLADAVRPTLGPCPRVVAVEQVSRSKAPELLDDAGVITRRIIQLPDRAADTGAMLLRHVLWRVHEEAGDATATAAVIFQAVYNRGARYVAAGGNAIRLRRHLERGLGEILDELDRSITRIEGKDQLAQLAESLCFDPPLARLLGEVFDIVGEYGQVDIRTSHGRGLERQYVEGMFWPGGVLSPHMLADQARLRTDLANAAILIGDLDLEDPRQLMPVLDMVMERRIPSLLIVANKLSDSAIALLLAASRDPERFRAIAARTPGTGVSEQAAAMEDLAILTGGRPLLKAAGDSPRGLKIGDLGYARRAWSDQRHLGIIGGKGDPRALRRHIASLRAGFKAADDPQRRAGLRQRIGKLMGGSAALLVGGSTDSEIAVREERARKTSELLRAALREGVLPGGGLALLACRGRLRRGLESSADLDEQVAYRILLDAVEAPFRAIVANAGHEAAAVMARVDCAAAGCGFDARSGQVVDMARAGIYDVAAAQKAAIRCAISGAATALTVDTVVHKRTPEASPGRP
jgi:chaperonin GroEL